MSRKTEYNARFSFEDPLSKLSLNRSSRYRIRKRKRDAESKAVREQSDFPDGDAAAAMSDHADYFDSLGLVDDTYDCDINQEKSSEEGSPDDYPECSEEDSESASEMPQEAPTNEPEQSTLIQVTSDLELSLYEGSELTVSHAAPINSNCIC